MCNVRRERGSLCRHPLSVSCRRLRGTTFGCLAETGMSVPRVPSRMCKYCNWAFHDGWGELLKYDDVYQSAVGAETESTHGFHEDWDDLRAELGI